MSIARLKGGTLVYTLSICMLVGMTMAGMVLAFQYERLLTDRIYFRELAGDNLQSAFLKTIYRENFQMGIHTGNLFDSELDGYELEAKNWGLYGILKGKAWHGKFEKQGAVMFGMKPEGLLASTMFLVDRNRPLTLNGKTRLEGNLYVPLAGIKRGYSGKNAYKGKQLYWGNKFVSKQLNPQINYPFASETRRRLIALWNGDAIEPSDQIPDRIIGDWQNESKEIMASHTINISDVEWRENIIITAPNIIISKSARLENVLLFANEIRIESGFEGSLQAFAIDTIRVEPYVKLAYPSVICVSNPYSNGFLFMGKRSELEGMCINDPALIWNKSVKGGYTLIDKGAKVFGNVISAFNLDVKGEIHGHVYTENFLLKTNSSIYENYLQDARITRAGLSDEYMSGMLSDKGSSYGILKNLNAYSTQQKAILK